MIVRAVVVVAERAVAMVAGRAMLVVVAARAALVVVAACATPAVVAPGAPPPTAPSSLPITAAVIPAIGRPVIRDLPDREDGAMLVTAGSLRVAVSAREVRFADSWFAEPITDATEIAGGWVFVTADGVVARAEHFLDEPKVIGNVSPPPTDHEQSCGRVVVVTPDGKLLSTDGTQPLAELSPGRRVTHAAFVDADHGMVVAGTGALYATRDAGRSFRKIDLHVSAVLDVECARDRFRVTTSTGKLDLDKAAVPLAPGPAVIAPYAPGLDNRIAVAALRKWPRLVAEQLGGVVADDGRVLLPWRDQLRVVDDVAELELGKRRCTGSRWGTGLGIACTTGIDAVESSSLAAERAITDTFDPKLVYFSSDGDHVAWPCGAAPFTRHSAFTWCTSDRQGHTRELRIARFEHPLGMRGDAVIAAGEGKIFAITGDRKDQHVLVGALPERIRADQLMLSGDGSMVAGGSVLVRRLVGLSLASSVSFSRPLPAGATRAAMATASLGIAVGRDRSHVWATRDAGGSWEAVAIPVTGALVDPRIRAERPVAGEIRCTPRRCVIDGRVVVAFDGVPLGRNDKVIAAIDPDPEALPPAPTVDLRCEPFGDRKPAAGVARLDDHLLERGKAKMHRASFQVQLAIDKTGEIEAAWDGFDTTGAYSTTAKSVLARPPRSEGELDPVVATRDGFAMSMLVRGRPTWLWLRPGGAVVETPSRGQLYDVLELPDQIAYLTEDTIVVVDKSGKIIGDRQMVFDHTGNLGLAYYDGVVGVQSGRQFYGAHPADAPRELPDNDIAGLNICVDPGPITAIRSYREDIPGALDGQPRLRRVFMQAHCIRAIELANQPDGTQIFASATGGLLETQVYRADIGGAWTQTLRCGHEP